MFYVLYCAYCMHPVRAVTILVILLQIYSVFTIQYSETFGNMGDNLYYRTLLARAPMLHMYPHVVKLKLAHHFLVIPLVYELVWENNDENKLNDRRIWIVKVLTACFGKMKGAGRNAERKVDGQLPDYQNTQMTRKKH